MSRLDRITSDPDVCHGQPTVRGLRCTVQGVLELLSAGMSVDEVLDDFPDLERDDVLAALEFAAVTVGRQRVVPLVDAQLPWGLAALLVVEGYDAIHTRQLPDGNLVLHGGPDPR